MIVMWRQLIQIKIRISIVFFVVDEETRETAVERSRVDAARARIGTACDYNGFSGIRYYRDPRDLVVIVIWSTGIDHYPDDTPRRRREGLQQIAFFKY